MMTGVFVGNTPASVKAHEDWLGRDIDSILVFTSETYWENWQNTLGWLRGGAVFGQVDRPLVWSVPLFPVDGSFEFAASPIPERRWQAETAVFSGSARILNDTKATPPTSANVAYLPSEPGGIEFTNLPAATMLRAHYYATVPGTMTLLVNGELVKTVNFAATRDPGNSNNFIYKELRLDVTVPEGGSLMLRNDGGSVWKTDFIAIGNYGQRYREAAASIAAYRPQDAVIFVRPGWEFNGDWYPWSGGSGNTANFIATFRSMVTEFRSVSERFRFDWCPNFGVGAVDPELCYPGDEFVDVVGMDLYDSEKNTGIDDHAARWMFYLNHARGLEWMRRFAGERNKLFAVSEWGVSDHNIPDHAGETKVDDNPLFVRNLQDWMAAHDVIYHHYWDSTSSYDGRLRDGTPPNTANQYVVSFSAPVPLSNGEASPPSNGSDEFNKSVPRAQWRFLRHDAANWSLTARSGMMRILSTATNLQGAVNTASNLLLQTAPDQDFEIVTRMYGRPAHHGQQSGLIVYSDDDNYIKMVRLNDGSGRFVFGSETDGHFSSSRVNDTAGGSGVYLKIARAGSHYRGFYSLNGKHWLQVGSKQCPPLLDARVGLLAFGAAGLTADFDSFIVDKVEAEHGLFSGSARVDPTEDPVLSGARAVSGLDSVGASVSWRNVPGGASLYIRYHTTVDGTQGLYVDGVRVRSIAFTAAACVSGYATLEVEQPIPAGATVKVQHDPGDSAWTIDYVTFVHEGRFEAEEATPAGATRREANPDASQEGAIALVPGQAGSLEFAGLNAGKHVKVRYRAETGGTMSVFVNGVWKQKAWFHATPSAAEPGKFVFKDLDLDMDIPPGGSLKLRNESGSSWSTDFIVVK